MPTPELGVSIVLLLLPVLAVAVGFVVGGYRHRYAIPMVLGLGGRDRTSRRNEPEPAVLSRCSQCWSAGLVMTECRLRNPTLGPTRLLTRWRAIRCSK
jgi:hypothetical protein